MAFLEKGLIEVYCGEGKGKTTAALGLSLRAHSRGARVLWTSFLKDYASGEFEGEMPFTLYQGKPVTGFLWLMTEEQRKAVAHEHSSRLANVFDAAQEYDVLVLDELLGAIETKCIPVEQVVQLLRGKPEHLEVVITGRYVLPQLEELAHYISRIEACKHPYEQGIPPRRGIEH